MDEPIKLIELPKEKADRLALIEKIYLKVCKLTHIESERLTEINKRLSKPISKRTFENYKKEAGLNAKADAIAPRPKIEKPKKEPKPIGRKPDPRHLVSEVKAKRRHGKRQSQSSEEKLRAIANQVHIRPDDEKLALYKEKIKIPIIKVARIGEYTDDEKKEIIRIICEYYALGMYNIFDLCQTQGIDFVTFHKWINANDYYYSLYNKAKDAHNNGFSVLTEEYFKAYFLETIQARELREVSLRYRIELIPDMNTGHFTRREVMESRTVNIKPLRPDAQSMAYLMGIVKEMRSRSRQHESGADLGKFEHFSPAQLELEIQRTRAEIENLKPKEQPIAVAQ